MKNKEEQKEIILSCIISVLVVGFNSYLYLWALLNYFMSLQAAITVLSVLFFVVAGTVKMSMTMQRAMLKLANGEK